MVDTAAADPEPLNTEDWTALPDERLLEIRMCDLRLSIAGTELEPALAEVQPRIAAVVALLEDDDDESAARLFVETIAFDPGDWDDRLTPAWQRFASQRTHVLP